MEKHSRKAERCIMTDITSVVADMIEVDLVEDKNFLKVKETLTRIGIASKDRKLYQSCHILQKRGKFYIVHFKELFMLDGKTATFSEEDRSRRNKIANLLEGWNLVKIVDKSKTEVVEPSPKTKVIKFDEKGEWELVPKYKIGTGKKREVVDAQE